MYLYILGTSVQGNISSVHPNGHILNILGRQLHTLHATFYHPTTYAPDRNH